MASCDIARAAGLALILFVAADVLLASALLLAGGPVSPAAAPAAAALSAAGTWALERGVPARRVVLGLALALAVALASVAVAASVVDASYDGNSYHKAAIGALAGGWNPVLESIDAYFARAQAEMSPVTHAIWADHYPKASWLFGSTLYLLTGSIESAKAVNLVMAAASALLAYGYLATRLLGRAWAAAASLLAAVNPITLPQALTNYVDGLLASTLAVILVLLVARADAGYARGRGAPADAALAAAVLVCCNIKFTGLAYAALFCASFWVLELARARRAGGARALGRAAARRTGYYLAVVAVSLLVAGSNSYVCNALDHGSPLYPLIGTRTVDIVRGYEPDSFSDMNPYKQFALSALSRTENLWKEDVRLKAPFTFDWAELAIEDVDTRRAGFGAFSSGIFIASGAVCLAGLAALARRRDPWAAAGVALAVPAALLVGLTDGSWWARYTPYLWAFPVVALVMLARPRAGRARKAAAAALALLMAVDTLTFAPAVARSLRCTAEAAEFVGALGEGPVEVALDDPSLGGFLYNLGDAGVAFRLVEGPAGDGWRALGFAGVAARPAGAP